MTVKEETPMPVKIIDYKILFYAPNIIGYLRIALLCTAFYNYSSSVFFLLLYSSSVILDAVDGCVARRFNQTSSFGAWLDVIIDNIGRGLLWVHLHPLFYIISVVEWSAFVCNYQLGPQWQEYLVSQKHSTRRIIETPRFISKIISNTIKNF
ncbi:CDP-diacylglycerol--inositol 3-phosphatidyltransferase 1, partial [Armadillidium nasatum]